MLENYAITIWNAINAVVPWVEAWISKPNNTHKLKLFFLPRPKFETRMNFQTWKKALKTLESSTSLIQNLEMNSIKYNWTKAPEQYEEQFEIQT